MSWILYLLGHKFEYIYSDSLYKKGHFCSKYLETGDIKVKRETGARGRVIQREKKTGKTNAKDD